MIDINPAQEGCRIDLPSIGLFVYYDRDDLYMSRVPTGFYPFIIHDVLKSNRVITDNGRASVFSSQAENAFHGRGQFGFIRTQPSDKGCSFSLSKGTHLFGSESVQGIIEVGSIAQECVKKNHPSAFHDDSRNNFVSETMCNLMGVPLRKWNWEYIDVIVSLGSKVIRHCDYVSLCMCINYCIHLIISRNKNNDYRPGYNHTAVHSFYDTYCEKMYKVSMIFTTRVNVGAHMEKKSARTQLK